MHQDDLKAIWICHECKMKFLFHSDIEDHKDSTGHKLNEKVMIVMVSPAETWSNGNHNRVIDLS
jgi:hypothetical protein